MSRDTSSETDQKGIGMSRDTSDKTNRKNNQAINWRMETKKNWKNHSREREHQSREATKDKVTQKKKDAIK